VSRETVMGIKPILVTGATGTVGRHVVRLLKDGGYPVRALVRNPAKATSLDNGIEVAVADLAKPETLGPAFSGIETAFVATNGLDIAALEGNAYDAARRAGVQRIVKLSGRHLDADFMQGTRLRDNQHASETRLRALGVTWTIIRPGFFASNFLLFMDRATRTLPLPVAGAKDTPTDPRDVADIALLALTQPGHENRIYEITGPEYLTYAEMMQVIAAESGLPARLIDITSDAARDGLVSAGVPPTQAEGLMRYFEAARQGKIYPPTDTIQRLLNRPPRSFVVWVRDHVQLLKG
jgi:uncharacterized protein YbjT (DUF2867 family)